MKTHHSPETVEQNKLQAVASFAEMATRMRAPTENDAQIGRNLLEAWDEPENPILDPLNYGMLTRGKFDHSALLAVPFVLALGGLYSRHKPDPMPKTVTEVARTVHENQWNFYAGEYSETEMLVRATRRGLAIVETFAPWSVFGRDKEARKAIKDSGIFKRRALKSILTGSEY